MKEYIDELDEAGAQTGRRFTRDWVHSRGLWHRTVHVWILNSGGELLIQRRSSLKESHPGLWDISAAGHCSSGDSSRGAAVREVKEELGLDVDPERLEYLFSVTQQFRACGREYIDNEFCDVYLFRTEAPTESLTVDESEISEVRFVKWRELEAMRRGSEFVDHDREYDQLFACLRRIGC
ncbi:MAG: NUDIX hydrolase [Fibrobacterota bacterium]